MPLCRAQKGRVWTCASVCPPGVLFMLAVLSPGHSQARSSRAPLHHSPNSTSDLPTPVPALWWSHMEMRSGQAVLPQAQCPLGDGGVLGAKLFSWE